MKKQESRSESWRERPHSGVAERCRESGLTQGEARERAGTACLGRAPRDHTTATGLSNRFYVAIWDSEKAASVLGSLCPGSFPLELLVHNYATRNSISS